MRIVQLNLDSHQQNLTFVLLLNYLLSVNMESIFYLLGCIAFGASHVYGDDTASCITDPCDIGKPCTCDYWWETGNDGLCQYDVESQLNV